MNTKLAVIGNRCLRCHSAPLPPCSPAPVFFQQIWRFWDLWLANERRISEITDRTGQKRWKIYDPLSDRSFQLASQQEVLMWLEERHYKATPSNL